MYQKIKIINEIDRKYIEKNYQIQVQHKYAMSDFKKIKYIIYNII